MWCLLAAICQVFFFFVCFIFRFFVFFVFYLPLLRVLCVLSSAFPFFLCFIFRFFGFFVFYLPLLRFFLCFIFSFSGFFVLYLLLLWVFCVLSSASPGSLCFIFRFFFRVTSPSQFHPAPLPDLNLLPPPCPLRRPSSRPPDPLLLRRGPLTLLPPRQPPPIPIITPPRTPGGTKPPQPTMPAVSQSSLILLILIIRWGLVANWTTSFERGCCMKVFVISTKWQLGIRVRFSTAFLWNGLNFGISFHWNYSIFIFFLALYPIKLIIPCFAHWLRQIISILRNGSKLQFLF